MAEEEQLNGMPQSMDTDDWAGTESDNEHDVDVDTVSVPRLVFGLKHALAIETRD